MDVHRPGPPPPTCRRPSTGSSSPGSTASRTGRGTRSRKPRSSGRCSTRPFSARSRAILTPSRPRWSSSAWPTSWRTRRGWRTTAWQARARDRRYRFTNALLQEVAYQSLLLRHRTELHARAGQALEGMVGERPKRLEDIEALARHWNLGGDRRKAARLPRGGRRLGPRTLRQRGRRPALRAGARRARPVPRQPRARSRLVRERLGDILAPLGRRAEALAHYEAVLAATAAAGDRSAQARLERKLATLAWDAGDRPAAAARLRAGLELMEGQPEHIELAHLYHEIGRQAFRNGDNEGAVAWAERALSQAERLAAAPVGPDALGRRRPGRRGGVRHDPGLQHPRGRAGSHGAIPGCGRAHRAEPRRRRGPRPDAGRLPRLHEPRRPLQHARPQARHRHLRPRDSRRRRRSATWAFSRG